MRKGMNELLVGYAHVSTEQQDLTAQRDALHALGVGDDRIYVDHGLTGTRRDRPGLREALAACRSGDTLVVTKLDRLARSLPDARGTADEVTRRRGRPRRPPRPTSRPTPPVAASASTSAARSTTQPTRSGDCCSTCSPWSPS